MPRKNVLALNCGSSSLKFGVFSDGKLSLEGEAEEVGRESSSFWTRSGEGQKQEGREAIADHQAAVQMALKAIHDAGIGEISAAGHRVVHGGPKLRDHIRLNDRVMEALKDATPFAPLHLPASLAVIEGLSKALSGMPQVICLDTAFHKNLPDVSKTLTFSKDVRDKGVERYGFHGLSLESILEQMEHTPSKLVVAHLGNGSSITAIFNGQSIDTSMGLTPSGGVMMGTRTGDVDPGVLIYLLRLGTKPDELETIVDHESGLKGISEFSSDVRELMKERKQNAKCDLALRLFEYQVRKSIAGMAATLGGLDLLVFTGGIGEHAQEIRDAVTSHLAFLGKFETRILPAQEDLQISRITERILWEAKLGSPSAS